jgi:hypothetical protein
MAGAAHGLTRRFGLLAIVAGWGLALSAAPSIAQSNTCAQEAASIRRAQSQLPRLEVAPPGDQQIVCITLETNILFARRLAAHLTHCPRSPLARDGNVWQRTGADYTAQFGDRRCKPAIRGFRS